MVVDTEKRMEMSVVNKRQSRGQRGGRFICWLDKKEGETDFYRMERWRDGDGRMNNRLG